MKKVVFWTAIVLLLCVFCFSAYRIGGYLIQSFQSKNLYGNLQSIVEANRPSRPAVTQPTAPHSGTAPTSATEATQPTEATEPPKAFITHPITGEQAAVLPEFAELYLQNNDLIGWIQIPGTTISFPVMQTPDRPNYYLKKSFNHKFNERGCIYVKEDCDVYTPSDNVVIYGHHFEDGSMFSPLLDYWDESFYPDHKYIYFDTLLERHTYEIVAVFRTVAKIDEGFRYHQFVNAATEAEFDAFMDTCKDLSLYDIETDAVYGDKLITLSTCDFSQSDGRMVIIAKRVA